MPPVVRRKTTKEGSRSHASRVIVTIPELIPRIMFLFGRILWNYSEHSGYSTRNSTKPSKNTTGQISNVGNEVNNAFHRYPICYATSRPLFFFSESFRSYSLVHAV